MKTDPIGPRPVDTFWLLYQDVWWYPYRRPALPVAAMSKPHRYNTVRMLERRAGSLALVEEINNLNFMPGDLDGFDVTIDDPVRWLHGFPLVQRLMRGLPTGGPRLATLAERARHWNDCPRRVRLHHPCTCKAGPRELVKPATGWPRWGDMPVRTGAVNATGKDRVPAQ